MASLTQQEFYSFENTDMRQTENLPINTADEMEIASTATCSVGVDKLENTGDRLENTEIFENGSKERQDSECHGEIYIKQEPITQDGFEQAENIHGDQTKKEDGRENNYKTDIDIKVELPENDEQLKSSSDCEGELKEEENHFLNLVKNVVYSTDNQDYGIIKTENCEETIKEPNPKKQPEKKKYNCDLCSSTFSSAFGLKTHVRLHTGEKPYECEICGKAFTSSSNLTVHIRAHTGEAPYKCEVCGKNFKQTSTLNVHKKIHEYDRPFKCAVCGADYVRKRHLREHIKTHKVRLSTVTKEIDSYTGEVRYKCDICGVSFTQSNSLRVHFRTHTGERPYQCDVCKMSFARKSTLKDHKRTHTGEKPYQCEICQMSFTLASSLKEHIRLHTGEKPYKCDMCDMAFINKNALRTHKRKHTGDLFKCNLCDTQFTTRSSLKVHETRKHASEILRSLSSPPAVEKTEKKEVALQEPQKPFTCETCGKIFIREYNYKQHLITHMDVKFKCDICAETFPSLALCQRHQKTHSVDRDKMETFVNGIMHLPGTSNVNQISAVSTDHDPSNNFIPIAPKPNENSSNRFIPMASNPDQTPVSFSVIIPKPRVREKKFKCDFCEKMFVSPSKLREHVRTHTGEKPFKCSYCDKLFTYASSHKQHERIHTGEFVY